MELLQSALISCLFEMHYQVHKEL